MLEEKDAAAPAPVDAMREEEGALRPEFVEHVAQAIADDDPAALHGLVGDLHAADLGDVIEGLEPELRPRLVKLLGRDFDFLALTEVDATVREAIVEELGAAAVAEGVRELESDDAVAILADLPQDEQTEILEELPARDADGMHRRAADMDGGADHRSLARNPRRARSVLGALLRRCRGSAAGDGGARPAPADQAPGADRRIARRGSAPGPGQR